MGAPTSRQEVLYVTRRYPPSVGGMETLAHAVYCALESSESPTLVALGRSQRNLPWFLPYAAARTRRAARRAGMARLVFGDPLLYVAVQAALPRSHPPVTVVVHGLDMTFPFRPYRARLRSALPKVDRVVAISRSTADIAIELGVDPQRCVVLNPGIEIPRPWHGSRDDAHAEILRRYALGPDSVVLMTLGRLVRRKGVRWLVTEVMPKLPKHVILIVAGAGAEHDPIRDAVSSHGLEGRVKLLGSVDDETRALLFGGCDAFVMPNIPVPGDVEGFGLVAIEASMSGAFVIASRLEGIVDAVADGETGWLCEALDADVWRQRILALADDLPTARRLAEEFTVTARQRSSLQRMTAEIPAALGLTD